VLVPVTGFGLKDEVPL